MSLTDPVEDIFGFKAAAAEKSKEDEKAARKHAKEAEKTAISMDEWLVEEIEKLNFEKIIPEQIRTAIKAGRSEINIHVRSSIYDAISSRSSTFSPFILFDSKLYKTTKNIPNPLFELQKKLKEQKINLSLRTDEMSASSDPEYPYPAYSNHYIVATWRSWDFI